MLFDENNNNDNINDNDNDNKILKQEIELSIADCRICYQEEQINQLISPCQCNGTNKYIHFDCLIKYIQLMKRTECDVCGTKFRIDQFCAKILRPNLFHFMQTIRNEIIFTLIIMLIMISILFTIIDNNIFISGSGILFHWCHLFILISFTILFIINIYNEYYEWLQNNLIILFRK